VADHKPRLADVNAQFVFQVEMHNELKQEFLMTGWDPISRVPSLKALEKSHEPIVFNEVETIDFITRRLQKAKSVDLLGENSMTMKMQKKYDLLAALNKKAAMSQKRKVVVREVDWARRDTKVAWEVTKSMRIHRDQRVAKY
jgi:hypothetical protein